MLSPVSRAPRYLCDLILGLAPQALCLRLLRRLKDFLCKAHPIHIHLIQFRLLGRQTFDVPGYTSAVNEAGWKDTIQANPGEITRILVPFGAQIPGVQSGGVPFGQSFTGSYVWHCHILDHEDNEMMQKYEIV